MAYLTLLNLPTYNSQLKNHPSIQQYATYMTAKRGALNKE